MLGGGAFGEWLHHEDEALVNGISALIEETPHPFHHMTTSNKWAIDEPAIRLSSDIKPADTLNSDVQPPKLQEINTCCLSHPVYGIFALAAQTD